MKVLLIFFITFYKIQTILSQECVFCKPRIFSEEVLPSMKIFTECLCPETQFCNVSTNKCNNCGDCFQFWHSQINTSQEHTARALDKLIKIFNQIQEHIKAITKKLNRQKNEIKSLEKSVVNVASSIPKVANTTKFLQEEVKKIEKKLKQIKLPNGSQEDLLQYFKSLKEEIEKMKKNLEDIKDDFLDKNFLTTLTLKLNNINDNIQKYNNQFPVINSHQNLNLVNVTENEISLLEEMLSKVIPETNNSTFPGNIKTSLEFIEKSLLRLFELLNNLFTLPVDLTEIKNSASAAKKRAKQLKIKTENLLKKQQLFEDLLQKINKELQVYRDIKMLKDRFEAIKEMIDSISKFPDDHDLYKKLNEAFEKHTNQLKNYKNKLQNLKKKRKKLEELLSEKKLLLDKAKNIKISNLDDLDDKLEKVSIIINELQTHCNSTLLQ